MRTRKNFTKEEDALIKKLYCKIPTEELVLHFNNRTTTSIISRASRLGINKRDFWSDEEDALLKKMHGRTAFKNMLNILPGRTKAGLKHRAQFLGLSNTSPNIRSLVKCEYQVNERFFENLNPLSCYWAGFIAADGYISDKDNGLSIGLQRRDEEHLARFLRDINSDVPIKHHTTPAPKDGRPLPVSKIYICRKRIKESLERNFNIVTNKSLIYTPPVLPFDLECAFMKGVIDGDGTISDLNNVIGLGIIGSKPVIDWAEALWEAIEPRYSHQKQGRYHYPEKSKAHTLKCSGTRAYNILSYIMNSVEQELPRKWSTVRNFVKTTRPYNRKSNENLIHPIIKVNFQEYS